MRLAIVFAAAFACASAASAEQNPAKIAITPQSERGAIIMRAPDLPKPRGSYISSYKIGLKVYDPVNQAMRGGPFGGNVLIAARPSLFAQGYLVSDVRPGTYVITDFSRQDLWALCFHDNSVQFTVRPGEVVYLGDFDARFHVMELEQMAISSGRTSLRQGNLAHFFDDVTPPRLKPGTETDLPQVAAALRAAMPKTTVAPTLAAFSPARFGTGRDLFGLQRICGGYYTGKAKPKS
jgi:hypothetical protein